MPGALTIRRAAPADGAAWERMRQQLWPDPSNDHGREIAAYFSGASQLPREVLLAVDAAAGAFVGFAELSIRPYAEGCDTRNVGFLEGWYVEPDHRRRGVGRALVEAALDWARAQGCKEFGSDTQLKNVDSQAAHRALGFEEVERLVAFKKTL